MLPYCPSYGVALLQLFVLLFFFSAVLFLISASLSCCSICTSGRILQVKGCGFAGMVAILMVAAGDLARARGVSTGFMPARSFTVTCAPARTFQERWSGPRHADCCCGAGGNACGRLPLVLPAESGLTDIVLLSSAALCVGYRLPLRTAAGYA
jgi:hypothetical protein